MTAEELSNPGAVEQVTPTVAAGCDRGRGPADSSLTPLSSSEFTAARLDRLPVGPVHRVAGGRRQTDPRSPEQGGRASALLPNAGVRNGRPPSGPSHTAITVRWRAAAAAATAPCQHPARLPTATRGDEPAAPCPARLALSQPGAAAGPQADRLLRHTTHGPCKNETSVRLIFLHVLTGSRVL